MEIYIVQPGDTLYSVARRYGTSAERLASDNGLRNPTSLAVGQSLVILRPTQTYTAAAGDSLYSIAQQFGVSINQLWRNNPFLRGRADIEPGQILYITLPPPTGGREIEVSGYVYPFVNRDTLRTTLPYLTYVPIFTYGVHPDGSLIGIEDDDLIAAAREYGVAPIMMLSSLGEDGLFSPELVIQILGDEALLSRLIDEIERTVKAKNYAGIEFDMEFISGEYAEAYANLVRRTRERLSPQGYLVFVDLAPKESDEKMGLLYEGHSYTLMSDAADRMLLMTYEYGFTYGPPMAVAPVPPVRGVLDFAVSVIEPGKLLLGLPNYGYDWALPFVRGSSKAESLSNTEAVDLAIERQAAIRFDEYAQAPYFNYFDRTPAGPVEHEVWFGDTRSFSASLALIDEYNLAGTGIWTAMNLTPQLLLTLNSMYSISKILE